MLQTDGITSVSLMGFQSEIPRRNTEIGKNAHEHGDAGKYQYDFLLSPAAQLEMMMNRRLFKDALALHLDVSLGIPYRIAVFIQHRLLGCLVICNLQDVGQGFNDINQANQHQNQGLITGKGQTGNCTAEKQGAGIAQK